MADIETEVTVTSYGGQAREMPLSCDLDGLDGIISLGEDGTFWEVASGLLERTQADENVNMNQKSCVPLSPKIPCRAIHGGSRCLAANDVTGIRSPVTAALQIALGFRQKRDVVTVVDSESNQFLGFSAVLL
jgi:hypothetical protein